MLVFQDSEMGLCFDFRDRERCSPGRCKEVVVFEAYLAFYVTCDGYAVFCGF